jgi:hypothetical protein
MESCEQVNKEDMNAQQNHCEKLKSNMTHYHVLKQQKAFQWKRLYAS